MSDNILVENFFVNLYSDPTLEKREFSGFTKEYIDGKVETFLSLMKEKGGGRHSLQRRSIDDVNKKLDNDVYVLEGFKSLDLPQNKSYVDTVLFNSNNTSFVANLEKTETRDVKLGVYQYNNLSFQQICETPVASAENIHVTINNDGIFLVVTEKIKIHIFEVKDAIISKIQTLHIGLISDVFLWDNTYGYFMGVARSETRSGMSYIYKWFGKHFDLVDKLESFGSTSIRAFTIGSSEFIAVCNSEDEYGQKEIFSAIFKYDVDGERYEIFQKISTNGAQSLEFSSFYRNGIKETFLIVLNSNKEGAAYHPCVIYKFIDNYFIPYESLNVYNPKESIIISTPNQEQLLGILTESDGLKIFSYDGWIFSEVNLAPEAKDFIVNITSIKTSKLANKDVLLIKNDNEVKVLEVMFTQKDVSKSVEANIMNWCEENLIQLESGSSKQTKKLVQVAIPQPTSEVSSPDEVQSAKAIEDYEIVGEFDGYSDLELNAIKIMESELNVELKTLKEIAVEISNLFTFSSEGLTIEHSIFFDELIINGLITLKELRANYINSVAIQPMLQEKFDIEKLNNVNTLQFEEVFIESFPELLNGKQTSLLLNSNNILDVKKVIVKENITVKNNTRIYGYLNGIDITKSNLFLNEINQTFGKALEINNLKINNLKTTGSINNKTQDIQQVKITKLKNLNVQNLNIFSYINNVRFTKIRDLALKSFGNQNLTETIIFDTIIAKEVNCERSCLELFNNFVKISDGIYTLENNISFDNVESDELNVVENMNSITVKEGALHILKRNVTGLQEIEGEKVFNNINVFTPTTNTAKSPIFISDEIIITSDLIVEGNISVENILNGGNIKYRKSMFGLGDINEEAIKLDETEITNSIIFMNTDVNNINTSFINNIPSKDFVQIGDQIQHVTGAITINSDIYIDGYTTILYINDIPLKEFGDSVLKVFGEQTLLGTYNITKFSADSVSSMNTTFGNTSWENVAKKTSQINSTINVDSLEIKTSHINNLKLTTINKINVEEILQNAVINEIIIHGNKTIGKLYVKNLFSKNEFNMDSVPHLIRTFQTNFHIENNLQIHKINTENINIEGYINDIKGNKFRNDWTEAALEHVFDNPHAFHNVTILGKATIEQNHINSLNLDDLFEKTVKINENHKFADVTFDKLLMVFEPIILHGNIVGLDLDSTVSFIEKEQKISGFKIFEDMVVINGSMELQHNIKNICEARSRNDKYHLIINGNAKFTDGPEVEVINGKNLSEFTNKTWLAYSDVDLIGRWKFHKLSFQNDIGVEGLVNGVEFKNLADNYFSKSKNQTVPAHLDFTEGINFFKGLKADEMLLEDSISGVRLKDVINNGILDGYTQIFDDVLYVDEIIVQDLNGEYLLNNMDIQKQIMRYDTENIVLGEMNIFNVTVQNLIANNDLYVQNVNISKWIQEAVMNNSGRLQICNFNNDVEFVRELGIVGYVNKKKFNNQTILLKSALQTITGNTIFNTSTGGLVYFQNLKLESLNGVNLHTFTQQLVSNKENVKIKSPVNIRAPMFVDNLEFKQLYNGINITNLLTDMTLFNIDNFYEHYTKLLNVSKQVQYSLDSYSNYLSHYEIIQILENVMFADVYDNYLITINNYSDHYVRKILKWDTITTVFQLISETVIPITDDITFTAKINVGSKSYLYIEDADFGYITKFSKENGFEFVEKHFLKNTKSLHNFQIVEKNLYCTMFISTHNSSVYCKATDKETFLPMQIFFEAIREATSVTMNEETFLVTSTQHEIENYVTIWQYHKHYERFMEIQHIYVASPSSISAISYKGSCYLAIASSTLEDAIYSGFVQIQWFHPMLQTFVSYQAIDVGSPKQVEFAILPSNELVLYVLTKGTPESLFVYEHEGLFGLSLKLNANINMNYIKFINLNREHLLLASGLNSLKVIRGIFKSQTYR